MAVPSYARYEEPLTDFQHRVKNLAAMMRSVSRRTADEATDFDAFQASFDRRLGVLVRVCSALARTADWRVDLGELAAESLEHNRIAPDHSAIVGPTVMLTGGLAETVGLLIEELASDLALGASEQGRRLRVDWTLTGSWLEWSWKASGGASESPAELAFARELVERAVPYQFGGSGVLECGKGVLACRLKLELPLGGSL